MRPLLTLAAWLVSLWLCWGLVRLSHATSLARRGQGRTHLLLTLAAVLGLVACSLYPAAKCVTSCGVVFQGDDCAGFDRLESATVAAFATCDAGSPDDACSALSGWTVRVLPASETFSVSDAGSRGWRPSLDEAVQLCVENPPCDPDDAGSVAWVQAHGHVSGETVIDRNITLADEAWTDGNAVTELVHAATGQYHGGDAYADEQWSDVGRACVVSTAQRAPLVLTGSEGGP